MRCGSTLERTIDSGGRQDPVEPEKAEGRRDCAA
jgi:hypothetical protein